jgi:hypothetical protein
MKRGELKQLLKPLVKECVQESVKEIVLESGLLSQVISEVVKGMNPVITEEKVEEKSHYAEVVKRSEKSKIDESRKQLMNTIGKTSYGGVNVFEGITEAIPEESNSSPANPMNGISPSDPGVSIDGLFDFNKAKILAQGRKKN